MGMRHVADDPAHVGPQGEFHPSLIIFRVDGGGMSLAGKFENFLQAVQHVIKLGPFPDGEYR